MPLGYFGWVKKYERVSKEEMEKGLLKEGDIFPKCSLTLLRPSLDRKYLELDSQTKNIRLVDIPAEYIYVEIFNELCFGCIQEIKSYKFLYEHFLNNKKSAAKIKLIGIGAGSKNRSVMKFRKKHDIPFPLFSDQNWHLFECLGSPTLPTSYLIQRTATGERKIIFVQTDHIEDNEKLNKKISAMIKK